MEKRFTRNTMIQKENDHKNMNKKDAQVNKIDRLLLIKKMNHLDDKEHKQLKTLRNSKEVRAHSKSFPDKTHKTELKPILEPLNNTQQYCQLYANDLLELKHLQLPPLGSFLHSHDIDKGLRARMLDWMIQVTSSYKFTPKTYFSAVHIMDRYFKLEDQRLPITKLHIIGVISMLIATKMDEVYPLKVKTVYEKIVHRKIDKKDLVEMQSRMTQKLEFLLNIWSFYDLALLKLHENWQVKNEEALKEIEELCHILGKFIIFNYELYGHYHMSVLAQALLRAACRIYGTERAKLALGGRQNLETSRDQHACLQLIMDTVKGHKSSYRNLTNIFKFSSETTMNKIQQYFKYM